MHKRVVVKRNKANLLLSCVAVSAAYALLYTRKWWNSPTSAGPLVRNAFFVRNWDSEFLQQEYCRKKLSQKLVNDKKLSENELRNIVLPVIRSRGFWGWIWE